MAPTVSAAGGETAAADTPDVVALAVGFAVLVVVGFAVFRAAAVDLVVAGFVAADVGAVSAADAVAAAVDPVATDDSVGPGVEATVLGSTPGERGGCTAPVVGGGANTEAAGAGTAARSEAAG